VKYHAPLWMIADLCRVKAEPGQATIEPPAASLVHQPSTMRSGDLVYPESLSDDAKNLAASVELLRANAVVGGLVTDLNPNREGDYSATVMFPDRYSKPIEDELGIAPRVAHLLHIAVPETGDPYFEPVNEVDRPHQQTLDAIFSQASRLLLDDDRNINPELAMGPIDRDMVVVSSLRGFRYQRVDNHLFRGGLIVDEDHTGFTVNRDESGEIPYKRIEIRRDQDDFEKKDFKAVVILEEPAAIPEGPSKLVLQVWAKSPQPNDQLPFVVGVYDNAKGTTQQLTTHFIQYDKAHRVLSPLPCDGRPRFVEVPLDGDVDRASKVSSVEIQAWTWMPQSWTKGAQLCITFAAIMPIDHDPETLLSSERVFSGSDKYPSLISTWWTDTELAAKGTTVEVARKGKLGDSTLVMSFTRNDGGWAGCTGELYPRQFVDKDRHVLRLKATSVAAGAGTPKASLGVVVYDGRRLLAAWRGAPSEVVDGIAIPLAATGIANEIVVVAASVGELKIEALRFETKAAPHP